ncbi:hypothetical protein [Pseudomonas koreensis]|uniref:hypothetical protein n=1 Tax=Pseudomonas koreensis TaxID=198620 RepID=UPI003D99DA2F
MVNKYKLLVGLMVLMVFSNANANQSTYGDCSSNIEGLQQGGTVNINCYFNKRSPQDAYLIATHPTSLEAVRLQFVKMFEDKGSSYLAIEFKNLSEIPARDVTVDVMNPLSAGAYAKLKPYNLKQSRIYSMLGTRKWTIPRNASTEFPLVSVEQLLSKIHPEIDVVNYCAFDGSLTIQEISDENSLQGNQLGFNSEPVYQDVKRYPVIVKVRYKTIFDEVITKYLTVFVLYAGRTSNGDIWYPSKKRFLPLQCIKF